VIETYFGRSRHSERHVTDYLRDEEVELRVVYNRHGVDRVETGQAWTTKDERDLPERIEAAGGRVGLRVCDA
jgi:hypothetical protein